MTDWPPPFGLPIACPRCAGSLELANSVSNGQLSVAILRCEPCDREFELSARLIPHQDPERHLRANRRAMQRQRERKLATAASDTPDTGAA